MIARHHTIGISQMAYTLPKTKKSLQELESANQMVSPAQLMRSFGFGNCYIHDNEKTFDDLLLDSGERILNKSVMTSDDIEFLFLYSGLNQFAPPGGKALDLFRYPVAKARHKLGLHRTHAAAISQQGCAGLLSFIYMAYRLLDGSDKNGMMCLTGDMLPSSFKREIMYNVMSDAGAALLVEKNSLKNRIVSFHECVQSYYWDTPAHEEELLASYFPMAQRAISSCLEQAGLKIHDIRWFVPHNVSLRSWEILAKLLSIPMERIWCENIERIGHTVSCDHIINLVDMETAGALGKNDYLVLFTFGFGASWSCLILQH